MRVASSFVLAGTLSSYAVAAGCGGAASPAGQGASCFRAVDCAAGLVCIAQVCTNDLSPVDLHEDAGTGGAAMMGGDAAGANQDGATMGAGGAGEAGNGGGSGTAGASGAGGAAGQSGRAGGAESGTGGIAGAAGTEGGDAAPE